MRSKLSFLAITGLTLALAACGDDTTGTGGAGGGTTSQGGSTGDGGSAGDGGGSADLATAFCEAGIAHDEECDPQNVATLDECLADDDTVCFGNLRPEVQQPLIDCLAARGCDEGDDACYFDVGDADPTEGQAAYREACATKEAECAGAFSEDYCFVTVLTTEAYASMTPCFDLACEEAATCLEEAFAAVCPG